jgi:hypothetical protein
MGYCLWFGSPQVNEDFGRASAGDLLLIWASRFICKTTTPASNIATSFCDQRWIEALPPALKIAQLFACYYSGTPLRPLHSGLNL